MNYGSQITKKQFWKLLTEYGAAIVAGHPFFEELAHNTVRNYRVGCSNLLQVVMDNWGEEEDGPFHPRDAQALVDHLIDTRGPGSARATVASMGSILSYMILYTDICNNTYNPFDYIKVPTSENIEPWTLDQIDQHLDSGSTYIARLVSLLYETGQRLSDVIDLTWGDFYSPERHVRKSIRIEQKKTGTIVEVPVLRNSYFCFTGHLSELPKKILTNTTDENSARRNYKFQCERVGIQPLQLHGLRKSAVIRMINAGATEFEIMAITGHKSTSSLRSYTKGYDVSRAAREAYRKVEANGH